MTPKSAVAALLSSSTLIIAPVAAGQGAGGWRVEGTRETPPFRLIHPNPGKDITYVFDCSGDNLVVTQTGVTELLDIKRGGNRRVPDTGRNRAMPDGAAVMAISTDPGDLEFLAGTAKPNPAKGWDITLVLPRQNKSFQSMAGAEFVILFTTGYTAAVEIEKDKQPLVADFVRQCGS